MFSLENLTCNLRCQVRRFKFQKGATLKKNGKRPSTFDDFPCIDSLCIYAKEKEVLWKDGVYVFTDEENAQNVVIMWIERQNDIPRWKSQGIWQASVTTRHAIGFGIHQDKLYHLTR